MTNKQLLSQAGQTCAYTCKCSDCPINQQCLADIKKQSNLATQKMYMEYPVGAKVETKNEFDKEILIVRGYETFDNTKLILFENGSPINLVNMEKLTRKVK